MGRLMGIWGPVSKWARTRGAEFLALGADHPDGWGLSGYNGHRAVYFGRSAAPVNQDVDAYRKALDLAESSPSPVLIGHFRHATDGKREIGSVHPFHHRDWIFAHDGSFEGAGDLVLSDVAPQGQTDSERLFHWLMEHAHSSDDPSAALNEALEEFRERFDYTSLTFILSNTQNAWAYCESRKQQSRLYRRREQEGTLVCSKALGDAAGWTLVPEKQLIEIKIP